MRHLWLTLLCSHLLLTLFAQTTDPRLAPLRLSVDQVPALALPALDNKALQAEEMALRAPGRAPRFAETLPVDVTPFTHGIWEAARDGRQVWRLRIPSPGARSLNLGFDRYELPPTASLILYTADRSTILGPFTPADNEEHGELWTPILPGDELIIELAVAPSYRQQVQLHLKTVNHDFLGFGEALLSGSCNLDVICGAADGWDIVDNYRDIIQSVAVISTGGDTFCTGFLVNNARQDCTPYFMTAAHCGVGANQAPSLVAYWNYENSACRQPNTSQSGGSGDGVLNDFNTGAVLRARYGGSGVTLSDMTLLELDDPVSETANAFFAGWDVTSLGQRDTVIGIHHPQTDEKRISFEYGTTSVTNYLSDDVSSSGTHIRIEDWDVGTTEGGSSGSPLFDANKRVIGQLSGGYAGCGNNDPDWYGWIHRSWTGGGTPDSRLRDWLDPDDTGITVLDGRWNQACLITVSPNVDEVVLCAPTAAEFQLSVSENFLGNVSMEVTDLPDGLTAVFSNNPAVPGSEVALTISGTQNVASGAYVLNLNATDGTNMSSEPLTLIISNGPPTAPTLGVPANGSTGQSLVVNLTWGLLPDAQGYEVQVSTDPAFGSTLHNLTGLEDPVATVNLPTVLTTYYWRVRSENACGNGPWSAPFSFTTAEAACAVLASNDVPVTIGTGPGNSYTSTLDIDLPGTISTMRLVDLDITHSFVGDLDATLTSPAGTIIQLFNQPDGGGCFGTNLLVTFDDQAANTNADFDATCNGGSLAISGQYQPAESFTAFFGEDVAGTWTLAVNDNAFFDGGAINGWQLDFCATVPQIVSVEASASAITSCTEVDASFTLTLGGGFLPTGTYLTVSGLPAGVEPVYSANPAAPGSTVTVTLSGDAATGLYPLTILADDGSYQAEAQIAFQVVDVPEVPTLDYPGDGGTDVFTNTLFTWLPVNDATEYHIVVATDPALTDVVLEADIAGTLHAAEALGYDTEYYWSVYAVNACGVSAYAPVHAFTTVPDLTITPQTGFQEVCFAGTADYELLVGLGFGNDITVELLPITGLSVSNFNYVFDGGSRELTVSMNGFVGTPGDYTFTLHLTTSDGSYDNIVQLGLSLMKAPGLTTLLGPTDGATVLGGANVSFSWQAVSAADEYTVQVATDEAFNDIVFMTGTDGLSVAMPVPGEGLYYWRVITTNECGDATTSPFTFSYLTTSVQELAGATWELWPNPTRGLTQLRLTGDLTGEMQVRLFGVNGQQLQQWQFPAREGTYALDVSELPAGVYLLSMKNGQASATTRLVRLR
ncbi:MAG: proprotein convertase P-domain-containing protein [Lewinella sp.]|nr:proprotein convertase P-domain-containing protein [Lewinella sp.]